MLESAGAVVAKPEYQGYVNYIDQILAKPEHDPINRAFAEFRQKRGHEPPWYHDAAAAASTRITSAGGLARSVGCRGEYDTLYKHSSYYVHGAFTGISLKYDDKGIAVAAIRTPEGWRQLFLLSVSIAADTFRRVIDRYRSGEVNTFVKNYVERWRAIIQSTPDVEVVLERIVNA